MAVIVFSESIFVGHSYAAEDAMQDKWDRSISNVYHDVNLCYPIAPISCADEATTASALRDTFFWIKTALRSSGMGEKPGSVKDVAIVDSFVACETPSGYDAVFWRGSFPAFNVWVVSTRRMITLSIIPTSASAADQRLTPASAKDEMSVFISRTVKNVIAYGDDLIELSAINLYETSYGWAGRPRFQAGQKRQLLERGRKKSGYSSMDWLAQANIRTDGQTIVITIPKLDPWEARYAIGNGKKWFSERSKRVPDHLKKFNDELEEIRRASGHIPRGR